MTPTAFAATLIILAAIGAVIAIAAAAVEWATERGWLDDGRLPWEGE